jgi:hypothetical protein
MPVSPEQWFHRRATHYVEAQVLFHLNQAGVFHVLEASGPVSVDSLAGELGLVPEVLAICLDYVTGVDSLLETDASGRYGLTEFGRAILDRFSRDDGDRKSLNFFDVRVGAYGPVWAGLGQLLSGEARYGEGVQRTGELAASAVYTVSTHLVDPLQRALEQIGARKVVEVGNSTGLLPLLCRRDPGLQAMGVDRSAACLAGARQRAEELGVSHISWQQADFFAPETWAASVRCAEGPSVIFSIHFHELMAGGKARMVEALGRLGRLAPGVRILALEQPLLPVEARSEVDESTWLYSHSNVLIHHLIGNGQILSQEGWIDTFTAAGGVMEGCELVGFLGYRLMVCRLGGGEGA